MVGDSSPSPRLIATVGLHGSASTWVFNVVRELVQAVVGADQVVALYAEEGGGVLAEAAGRHVVLKSHHGGPGWEQLLWLARAPVLLSIRDPRDAAVSLVQRFRMPFAAAVQGLQRDCSLAIRLAEGGVVPLRYEDRFFDDPAAPARLARMLLLPLPAVVTDALFTRYRTDAVRAFAAAVPTLSDDRLVVVPDTTMLDRITQIHRNHIGDARSGKWRELVDAPTAHALTVAFAPFLERFRYPV